MNSLGQLLAFGAGAFCLGVTLTLGVIFAMVSRHSHEDNSEGCLGIFLNLIGLSLAAYFFFVAVTN